MKKLVIVLGVVVTLAILVIILIAVAGGSYNHLVRLSQGVDSQWAQVQNVNQRRADLIPNLVATVSGAANFEKSTLTEITAARASVGQVHVNPNTAPSDPAKLAEFEQVNSIWQNWLNGSERKLPMLVPSERPSLDAGFRMATGRSTDHTA